MVNQWYGKCGLYCIHFQSQIATPSQIATITNCYVTAYLIIFLVSTMPILPQNDGDMGPRNIWKISKRFYFAAVYYKNLKVHIVLPCEGFSGGYLQLKDPAMRRFNVFIAGSLSYWTNNRVSGWFETPWRSFEGRIGRGRCHQRSLKDVYDLCGYMH